MKYFSNFLKTLGYKRLLLQSGREPSIVALKVQAAAAAGVEGVPRQSPVSSGRPPRQWTDRAGVQRDKDAHQNWKISCGREAGTVLR